MRLIEIIISITTRHLEYERNEFIHIIDSIINNNVLLTDIEFERLLELSSMIIKKYNIDDSGFNEVFKTFSKLVNYHKNKRGK